MTEFLVGKNCDFSLDQDENYIFQFFKKIKIQVLKSPSVQEPECLRAQVPKRAQKPKGPEPKGPRTQGPKSPRAQDPKGLRAKRHKSPDNDGIFSWRKL
jgi:hypothetical protein